jgi:adenylate cyclase
MEKWQRDEPQTIKIRLGCGIHTGEVLVGNMGTKKRDDFTAISAHVNLARRIEKRAGDKQILVSVTTKQRIQEEFDVREEYILKNVKNIPGEYPVFEIIYCEEKD